MTGRKIKNYGDTWLYNRHQNYEKIIYEFLMNSNVVEKNDPSFDDIKYEVKRRQIHNCIVKILEDNNVVLLVGDVELPRSFKVFAGKDVKNGGKTLKIFIDCTNVLTNDKGNYELPIRNVDVFISYLVQALAARIYYDDPNKLFNNNQIITSTTESFMRLFNYTIDTLRVGNVDKIKEKVSYLAAMYFQTNVMDNSGDTTRARAIKLSEINTRDADVLDIQVKGKDFENIDSFITALAKVLKCDKDPKKRLDTDVFIHEWVYRLGKSSLFGLELFTAFSNILTDTYVSAYLNNQKTIEKICNRCVTDYTNLLLKLGSDLLR